MMLDLSFTLPWRKGPVILVLSSIFIPYSFETFTLFSATVGGRHYDRALTLPVLLEFFVEVALEASSAVSSHLLQRGLESFHLLLCPLPQTQTVKPNKPGAFMNTWSKLKLVYEDVVVVSRSVCGYRGWQIPRSPSVTDCRKIHFTVRSYGKTQIFYFHENIIPTNIYCFQ